MTWRTSPIGFGLIILLLVACCLGGGSSRLEVPTLMYLRPVAVVCLAGGLILLTARPVPRELRAPCLFLGAFAVLMLLQLVPLPPGLWRMLPGHAFYAEASAAAGVGEPWRPLTLSPDRTINALLTLLFPAAMLALYAGLDRDWRFRLVPVTVAFVSASAILGVFQMAAGEGSAAYFFSITHAGSPVGIFANRNHQGTLLAAALPILRLWTLFPTASPEYKRARDWFAAALALFFIALIIVTGSRAGVVAAGIGIVGAILIVPPRGGRARNPGRRWLTVAMVAAPVLVAGAVLLLGRGVAFDRMFRPDALADARFDGLPVVLRLIGQFFPFGAGFGTFDPVFRMAEPEAMLSPAYFNHAHDDLLEIVLDGGLPALLLLVLFLGWGVWRALRLIRAKAGPGDWLDLALSRAAGVVLVILLFASTVDYPLRTPAMAAFAALACGWFTAWRGRGQESTEAAL